jgi:hypothetical protein
MYPILIAVHHILRWAVVLLAIFALFRAYSGWLGRRPWTPTDRMSGSFFAISIDIQVLIGFLLYFIGPWFNMLIGADMAAMTTEVRFFAMEHILIMILALIVAHVGLVVARRAPEDTLKFRRMAIWLTVAALLVVAGIPWWRPLFPGLG